MKTVQVRDKVFECFITQKTIENAIDKVARSINSEMNGKKPIFICVLNGSFMFAAELMKRITIPSEITFVKMASYIGTSSTGKVKEVYGLEEDIEGRNVIIVEDIIDTGHTIVQLLNQLNVKKPAEIKVCSMLLKPDALLQKVPLDYIALEIPSDFIIGYGLDYDGYGRNLPDIYKIANS